MKDVVTVTVEITPGQAADFEACAAACGRTMAEWIVECAVVKAAAVIDAVQETRRLERSARRARNAHANALTRKRRG